jgi:cell division transport system permease protein
VRRRVALGAVALALRPLNTAIAEFARCMPRNSSWPLPPLAVAALLALSAGLGLIGARLSVKRHTARLN